MAYSFGDGAADVTSSTASGAAAGAAIGSIVPGVGTAIGAAVGGAAGLIGGAFKSWASSKNEEEKRKIINNAAAQYNASADEIENMFENYYATNPSIGTQSDVELYRNLIASYNPEDYAVTPTKFSDEYTKTVDDFIDPYADEQIQAATDAVSASAAGAGLGRGTGAARAIAQKEVEVNGQLADKAFNRYMQDRSQSYNEYNGYITQLQNYLSSINSGKQYQISQYGNLADNYTDTQRQQLEDMAQMKADRANSNLQLQLAKV